MISVFENRIDSNNRKKIINQYRNDFRPNLNTDIRLISNSESDFFKSNFLKRRLS